MAAGRDKLEYRNAPLSALHHLILKMAVLGLIPAATLGVLQAFDVPIGQPFFLIYRYSPFPLLRAESAIMALLIGALGLWILARVTRKTELAARTPLVIAGVSFAMITVWTFFAPPNHAAQHIFNMQSPSHEGAFVIEARGIESVRHYAQDSFYDRLENTPEQMLGRRVLSNPPGMTLLFLACRRVIAQSPLAFRFLSDVYQLEQVDDPSQRIEFAAAILYAMVLTALWGLSIVPAYGFGRLFLPQLPAMCLAFACVFNPATVSFSPGKDPAQLLTVMAVVYLWLHACVRRRRFSAALSGAAFVVGLGVGLIHIWVLAIIMIATLGWYISKRDRAIVCLTSVMTHFLAGALAMCLVFYVAMGWNVVMTAYAVGAHYREIQVPIITDPFYWTLVGLPMFLLFVGPYFWSLLSPGGSVIELTRGSAGASPSLDHWIEHRRFGGLLLLSCIVVMALTYFYGNNNETPRLWIPFIPLLLLGLTLRRSLLHTETPASRRVCLFLIAIQLFGTLAHWSLMDVRESEYRLTTGRMWN